MKFISLFLVVLMLTACNSQSNKQQEFDLVFESFDSELIDEIVQKLEAKSIPYLRDNTETIKYESKYYALFSEISREVIRDDLPSDRSITFLIPGLNDELIQKFDNSGISYNQKSRNNTLWTVWSEKDHNEAQKIIDELKKHR